MKFRRWSREIGLPDSISLHSLRATFACQLLKKEVDIYTISRLLEHSNVKMTEKYYLVMDPDKAREAVELLKFTVDNNERSEETMKVAAVAVEECKN